MKLRPSLAPLRYDPCVADFFSYCARCAREDPELCAKPAHARCVPDFWFASSPDRVREVFAWSSRELLRGTHDKFKDPMCPGGHGAIGRRLAHLEALGKIRVAHTRHYRFDHSYLRNGTAGGACALTTPRWDQWDG